MTKANAAHHPGTAQALSGQGTCVRQPTWRHIDLSREADAIVIAPASTDFLAKLAHGMADDLLATLCVARRSAARRARDGRCGKPGHAAQRRTVARGRNRSAGPTGPQACGEIGDGRMLEAAATYEAIASFFAPKIFPAGACC